MTTRSFGLVTRLFLVLIATVVLAQLINSVLLVSVASNLRTERAQAVVIERVVQGVRLVEVAPTARRAIGRRRGFRVVPEPPSEGQSLPKVEAVLAQSLEENGFGERQYQVVRIDEEGRQSMQAAVQLDARNWLLLRVPMPRPEIPWEVVGVQTLILSFILLLPALWVGRTVALPLRRVTAAAENFLTGTPSEPLPKGGPPDIDALCRTYEALEQRILSALEERSAMLGAIGHDLRTPLASLRIRVESVDDDELREGMIQSITDLASALDDILTFSSDISSLGLETVRSDAILERLASAYLEEPVVVQHSPSFRIQCSPESLLRALRNLVDNALRYAGNAEIAVTSSGEGVLFVVTDRGPGMPEDRIEDFQRPFVREEGSRNRASGGSGLGLAIVRAVAQAHHGSVNFRNRPEGGLEVKFLVPMTRN